VVGCFPSTLAKLQIGGAGERICQGKYIKIITTCTIPIQVDGEPQRLAPSIIEIKHKNQALMLERVKSSVYANNKK
jgi:diacylglycerol kinase (ATP)